MNLDLPDYNQINPLDISEVDLAVILNADNIDILITLYNSNRVFQNILLRPPVIELLKRKFDIFYYYLRDRWNNKVYYPITNFFDLAIGYDQQYASNRCEKYNDPIFCIINAVERQDMEAFDAVIYKVDWNVHLYNIPTEFHRKYNYNFLQGRLINFLLYVAISTHNIDFVKRIIDMGANEYIRSLRWALIKRDKEIFDFIQSKAGDISKHLDDILITASYNGYLSIVEEIINVMNNTDTFNKNSLNLAIKELNLSIKDQNGTSDPLDIDYSIRISESVSSKLREIRTNTINRQKILNEALEGAIRGKWESLSFFLIRNGAEMNRISLGAMVEGGFLELVKASFDRAKTVEEDIYTLAVYSDHLEILAYIFGRRGLPNVETLNKIADTSVYYNKLSILKYLLSVGANNFDELFKLAVLEGHMDMALFLMNNILNISQGLRLVMSTEYGNGHSNELIDNKISNMRLILARKLLDMGATVTDDMFPFVYNDLNTDLAKILLERGINFDIRALNQVTLNNGNLPLFTLVLTKYVSPNDKVLDEIIGDMVTLDDTNITDKIGYILDLRKGIR